MPRIKKYQYLRVLQQYTECGWEDISQSESRKEIREDLKAYRTNAPGQYRVVGRREINPEFKN